MYEKHNSKNIIILNYNNLSFLLEIITRMTYIKGLFNDDLKVGYFTIISKLLQTFIREMPET